MIFPQKAIPKHTKCLAIEVKIQTKPSSLLMPNSLTYSISMSKERKKMKSTMKNYLC